jgi:type II secretory pathway pseudopilin PulG
MISMKNAMPKSHRRNQAGFGLLMAIFLVATMILIASVAVPSILTEGQRQKEAETVWRGEQYERAIGMYYRKFNKYPTKIEDLTNLTNGVRFLRQAYTDPMNKEDGKWRFIYVGPNGQLIGSVKQTSLLQNSLGISNLVGAGNPFAAGLQPLSATVQATAGGPGGPGAPGQQTNSAASLNPLESQPQPLGGTIIGGNIIGVGSKIKKPSFRVYLGGDTYEKWEFIWNPTPQGAVPGQTPVNPNANPTNPTGGVAGPNAVGQPLQNPQGSGSNPPGPNQY